MNALVYHSPGKRAWELVTYELTSNDLMNADDTFRDGGKTKALKVIIRAT
jgi:hypothetical protein